MHVINIATGSKEQGMFAELAIGSTVLLEAIFAAGPVCEAGLNPERSIAAALISGHIAHLWIYKVAAIGGTAFPIPVFKILHFNKQLLNQSQ